MRIILTTHQFVPHHSAGTEILTFETAKALQKHGHHVSVFTAFPTQASLKDEERFDRYIYHGIKVERFQHGYVPMGDQSNIMEMEYNNHLLASYFRDFLRRERPDIVHFFHLSRLSASPIDVCRELGVPTVFTPTDFWLICPTIQLRLPDNSVCAGPDENGVNCLRHMVAIRQSPKINAALSILPDWLVAMLILIIRKGPNIKNRYLALARALSARHEFLQVRMNRIGKVAIPTQIMLSKLTQNGLEIRRTASIPFGLNLAYLQKAKRPKPGKKLRLGFIGTIYEHKGVHVLVEAVRLLAGEPVELKIYGDVNQFPEYVEKLKKMAQEDPRIMFCGTFPNQKIGAIFSGLDVLVAPSLWHENAPLVIYSAQAVGCPVIASNMAGMSEIIEHEKNGLLFEAGNALELATAIETLLDNRGLLQKLSGSARKPLSIQEYALKLLEIYDDLIQKERAI